MRSALARISNRLLSVMAGGAAFGLTLIGFMWLSRLDQQVAASLVIGLFALAIVRLAAERPNSEHARALAALVERLLAVRAGDLGTPAPAALRAHMPDIAAAVDGLFEQVRSNLDNVHAMALYDPVTELPNRVHFRREAERILKGHREDTSAMLFIDLDGFKEVNDRLGHAQGDQTLIMVANRLRCVVQAETEPGTKSPPLLARLAGDEFTVLLPRVEGQADAERVAERALAALAEPFRSGADVTFIGASIGVALAPAHGRDLTTLMKAADVAMYRAKAAGRSRVCVYDPDHARAAEERARAEQVLRAAIAADELTLAFQPRLCLRSGEIVGADARPAWRGPDGLAAVAAPEDSSLVFDLGHWSLAAVAEARRRWRAAGAAHRISLGLSARIFEQSDFLQRLSTLMDGAASPQWPVEVELGEAAVMRCGDREAAQIASLAEAGIAISIGGFGSGHCPLDRLRRLPPARASLDPALVAGIDASESARTVAAAVVHLLHGLGFEAVARGVERPAQLEILRAVGCDFAQGPLCGEAMAEDDFLAWTAAYAPMPRLARAS